jgi:predicted phage tail protein
MNSEFTAMAKARAKAAGYYVSMLMTAGSFLLLAGIIAQPLLRF